MKILHVVENLNVGGLETFVIDLAVAQKDAGHDVSILCIFEEGVLAQHARDRGVGVDACGKETGMDLSSLLRIRKVVRSRKADVIHTHNAFANYFVVVATFLGWNGRIVNTRHGLGADPASRTERLYRLSAKRTDHVVAVSIHAQEKFEADGVRPRKRLLSIANGIDTTKFRGGNHLSREELRQRLSLPEDALVVGTVGRLNWAKDQGTLLEAFSLARRHWPNAALAIVGDGELRAQLEARAFDLGLCEHVRFLGNCDDVAGILPGFDIFALSSVTEGYSIALLEACASALPIVATSVGGNGEIVRQGTNGYLVPPSDPGALAAAMGRLLSGEGERERFGMAGREWALEHATLRKTLHRYMNVYAETPRSSMAIVQ